MWELNQPASRRTFRWPRAAREMVRKYLNSASSGGSGKEGHGVQISLKALITRIAAVSGNPRGACWGFVRQSGVTQQPLRRPSARFGTRNCWQKSAAACATKDKLRNMLIPAVQYLRVSTQQQPCSIEIQKKANQDYAAQNGFVIVSDYVDLGRTGINLSDRPGLSKLLQDVVSGQCKFQAILVYDISRWGRFQDADESAHYEFLCKSLHVPVHYCAEPFGNDNDKTTFILKALKRAMAAEYSRELSARVFRGQKHLAQMGFHLGSVAGYALRRMLISADGSRQGLLQHGEYKSLATDRVILVPGPPEEVRVVREIFAMALKHHMGFTAIATELNRRGVQYQSGRQWRDFAVKKILTSRKYVGCNMWNRTSRKLGIRSVRIPDKEWVKVDHAFLPLIDLTTFEAAQEVLPTRPRWTTEEIMSRALRGSKWEPEAASRTKAPVWQTVRRRSVGVRWLRSHRGTSICKDSANVHRKRIQAVAMRNQVFDTLLDLFPGALQEGHLPRKSRPLLQLSNGMLVSVIICLREQRKTGILRWTLYPPSERNMVTLVCLQDRLPKYYLLPLIQTEQKRHYIRPHDKIFRNGIRLSNLGEFYNAACLFATPSRLASQNQVL